MRRDLNKAPKRAHQSTHVVYNGREKAQPKKGEDTETTLLS